MTGFGRAQGTYSEANHDIAWLWEIRAVNGKGLDIRLRLPSGFERIEQVSRKQVSKTILRGNLQISLSLDRKRDAGGIQINEDVLDTVLASIAGIESRATTSASSAAQILALRGVMEPADDKLSSEQQDSLDTALLKGLEEAISSLNQNRLSEGAELETVLKNQVAAIEALVVRAEQDPSRSPEALSNRLNEQIKRLGSDQIRFDADRVRQEIALLATKADIREELDRLGAHVAAARNLLKEEGAIGRKFEFLAQEFNRESNTLCSKSNAVSLTEIGLELKVVIDQFREQVLNVE